MAGNITVVNPDENYKPICKAILFDKEIDILTLGLFSRVISVADKWDLNIKGLSAAFGISEAKVRASIALLEERGYLTREPERGDGGKLNGWNYTFYNANPDRISKKPQYGENRNTVETAIRSDRNTENREDINIKSISKQEIIQEKEIDIKKKKCFVKPTVDEVRAYCQERRNLVDPQRFFDFYEMKGWMVGKTHMKDWKAAVRTWEGKDNRGPQQVAPYPRPASKDVSQKLNASFIENMYKK